MILKIDNEQVEVLKDMHHEEKPEICKALDRVHEELKGFLNYKELEKSFADKNADKPDRYGPVSMQEFQHMLLALDDFCAALVPALTPAELAEWRKFKASIPG